MRPGSLAVLYAVVLASPVAAAQVSGLVALHHDGQTFLTWTCPPGVGWTYRIYRSPSLIESGSDLARATLAGESADSTWCDRRLYSLSGSVYGFCIDSLAAPLDSTRGLFVLTPDAAGPSYYAVTCRASGCEEDTGVIPDENSLIDATPEAPARPRPVYQRTMVGPQDQPADVYTLWASDRDTPCCPAMCNRPGEPYDCSVHRGGPGGALVFYPHARGGSFYIAQGDPPLPDLWQLTMDDFVRALDVNTFWFGYHRNYDVESSAFQSPPTTGTVSDYTARRMIFTLEWARRNFPVDTARVYVSGGSMGGIGGVFLSMWRPDLIAATIASVPLFDFSFESDPNRLCQFNAGGQQRSTCDCLWGEVGTDLRMEDGTRVYERLNCGALAAGLEARFVPPILAFSGRNDVVIGWAEKIPFYRAMNRHRGGGMFFWDNRTHSNARTTGAWWPMQDYRYLFRFRTDLSFPALSNCSADGDPGNGEAASGDSIGTINGFVEWDPPVDQPDRWHVRMALRDLTTLWGAVSAPESVTVDVTPRRLRAFTVVPGERRPWWVRRELDGAIVQSGLTVADDLGVLTIPGVKVHRSGCVLDVGVLSPLAVGGDPATLARAVPRIGPVPSPLRGPSDVSVEWPRAGEATVDVLDVAGRRMLVLYLGRVERGSLVTRLDPGGMPGGIYFLIAREGATEAVRRFAVAR